MSLPGHWLRSSGPALRDASRRASRAAFIARAKIAAATGGGFVELDVHPDAVVHPGARVEVWRGTRSSVAIGPGTQIGDRVLLSLRGGSLEVGGGTQVRRFATLHVGGRLTIGNGCVISTGICVHCAEAISIADDTIIGEFSTIVDSSHVRTPPGQPIWHTTRTAPTRIGSNCWFGAGVVVASGITVGDQAVVAAGSVITADVEYGWLVGGVPARAIKLMEEEGRVD